MYQKSIWLTSFLLLLTLFDIEITAAVASLTVFSLVIGMALQESASNMIISGQLMLDSPYDIGDKIEVNGRIGVVTDIGVLSTKVRTPGEQLMVIPNKIMATSTITNFARGVSRAPRTSQSSIDIGVGYNESPEHVKNVIREILQENDEVVDEPKPLILLTDLLDSALLFEVNTHVNNYQNEWIVRDQILSEIIRRFRQEKLRFHSHTSKYSVKQIISMMTRRNLPESRRPRKKKQRFPKTSLWNVMQYKRKLRLHENCSMMTTSNQRESQNFKRRSLNLKAGCSLMRIDYV